MKRLGLSASLLALAATPVSAEPFKEVFHGEWSAETAQEFDRGQRYGTFKLSGQLTVEGRRELDTATRCFGWESWSGSSGGVCTVTDDDGDVYSVEYSCDRPPGWPPPLSCAPGYWRSIECGQTLVLPEGVSFTCEGATLARGGTGKYANLRGRGRLQQFSLDAVESAGATGYWLIETDYRR